MQEDCQERSRAQRLRAVRGLRVCARGRAVPHNLNYWQFGDYLGIGAGAHGKLTSVATVTRTARQSFAARDQAAARVPAERGRRAHQRSLRVEPPICHSSSC